MKKILTIIICIAVVICAFSACSGNDSKATTVSVAQRTTEKLTTDSAVITQSDAINLIESYSEKELGLSKEDKKRCSFMVASDGVKIKDKYYVEVIATIKTEHNDDGKKTYTFDNLGQYYIRYDGKQILSKNMNSGSDEYSEMKVKAVPSTTDPHADDETKESKNE